MVAWKSGIEEAVVVSVGAVAGAYAAKYIPGGMWGKLLIGFALAWLGAAWDGMIGDFIMGLGVGAVIMGVPNIALKARA
ncbi:MAG: hypothetical protein RXR82_06315 [Nitrososphaeria archaeon]